MARENRFDNGDVAWHSIYENDFGETLIWEVETSERVYRVQVDPEEDSFRLTDKDGGEEFGVFDSLDAVREFLRERSG